MLRRRIAMLLGVLAASVASGQQPMRVVVNIPAYRLDVYASDSIVRTMRVAVGMRRYPTPRGEFAITRVEWNPWWIPPDRAWAAREHVTPPGPDNPMGRVKLYFKPFYFIHGTPAEQSLGSAASHGCIRMSNQNAIELARLVSTIAGGLTRSELDLIAADTGTRNVMLNQPVPTDIRYDLAELRWDSAYVYPDVYSLNTGRLADRVFDALVGHGVDSAAIDSGAVAAFTRRLGGKPRTIPVRTLLKQSALGSLRLPVWSAGASHAGERANRDIGSRSSADVSCW